MALTSFLKFAHRMIVRGGNGGMGKVCFTKQTRSGLKRPDGGNGGNGGDVILRRSSLYSDFDHLPEIINGTTGDTGKNGGCRGANGTDKTVLIPHNATLKHCDTAFSKFPLVVRGGRGLAGNHSSLKPNNRTAVNDVEEYDLFLGLEKYVDYAFIGPPNAGKTTLTNLLCNTNFKTSFIPGNTEKPNIGALSSKVSKKIGMLSDTETTIGDFPGGFDVAYLSIFRHALALSKGIVIVSDDPTLCAHLGLVEALQKLNPALVGSVKAFVKTKSDRGNEHINTTAIYSSSINFPVFLVSAVSGEGIISLSTSLTTFNRTPGKNFQQYTPLDNTDT